MRSFIALKLSQDTRDALADVINRMKGKVGRVGWVNPVNLHLTLKFLGEVPENKIEEITRALKLIAKETISFGLSVESLGCFPNERNPRVIWSGLHGNFRALQSLYIQVDKSMEWLGFARERRGFKPHITLGRVKGDINTEYLAEEIGKAQEEFFGEEWIDRLYLMKSDLKPTGAVYSVLSEFNL